MDVITYPVQVTDDDCYLVTVSDDVYNVDVAEPEEIQIDVDVVINQQVESDYDGAYTVIPKAYDETILPTEGKTLAADVTVTVVPYYETTNTSGKTVYIASEV